jgi:hypothetical protein
MALTICATLLRAAVVFLSIPHPSNVPARNWADTPLLRVFCDANEH